jgi:hypothetical protein
MTQEHGSTPGAVWRAIAWAALLLAVIVAVPLLSMHANRGSFSLVAGAAAVVGFLFMCLCCAVGIACGIFGAVAASDAGDRRFLMILPVYANALLLLGMLALTAGV